MLALLSLATIGCSPDESPAGTGPALTISPSASGSTSFVTCCPDASRHTGAILPQRTVGQRRETPFLFQNALNDAEHKLIVTQSLIYHNNTGTELKIYFNLIPQAFRQDSAWHRHEGYLIGNQPGSWSR